MACGSVEFVLVGDLQREVIQADAILVESVGGARAQPDPGITDVVDDATEQECEPFPGGIVGVGGHLHVDRPAEDTLVEPPRPLDVGDGQPDVCDGIRGDHHRLMLPVHATEREPDSGVPQSRSCRWG